ncbi:Enkurin domain-containing protein 1 [Taenia solium]|eukprot:TsM_000187900 transcript=TsM_000187900 gene=TsM_000187900
MDRNQGSILNLLQWQNAPRFGSVGCNRRPASDFIYLSVGRDFIRENIRSVRSSKTKPISAILSSRISDSPNVRTGIIERYLSDIDRDQDQAIKMELHNNDNELDQQTKPTTSDEGTQTEMHNNSSMDCCLPKSPSKHCGFLRAHEKTGQLNAKIQLSRKKFNYIRANANAVSSGCVLDRRSTNEQSRHSSSPQRRSLGRLPTYLIRRRKEEEEKATAKKKAEERDVTPTGYRRVSKEERENTLRSLEEAHAKTLEELTRAPIHMSTNRARTLRAQLADRLSDIEEVINVFRKPVVFITLN